MNEPIECEENLFEERAIKQKKTAFFKLNESMDDDGTGGDQ